MTDPAKYKHPSILVHNKIKLYEDTILRMLGESLPKHLYESHIKLYKDHLMMDEYKNSTATPTGLVPTRST